MNYSFQTFQYLKFPKFEIPRFQDSKITRLQDSKIPRFQDWKTSFSNVESPNSEKNRKRMFQYVRVLCF